MRCYSHGSIRGLRVIKKMNSKIRQSQLSGITMVIDIEMKIQQNRALFSCEGHDLQEPVSYHENLINESVSAFPTKDVSMLSLASFLNNFTEKVSRHSRSV